jgi:hypothetical protein
MATCSFSSILLEASGRAVLPLEVTLAVVEEQMPLAQNWSAANGWDLTLDPNALVIDGHGRHPTDGRDVRLIAGVDSYPALPPSWQFVDPLCQPSVGQIELLIL